MADKVAKAIHYIGQEDFDLFGDGDRHTLMTLVEDYFCGDKATEMSSSKPRLGVGLNTIHFLLPTDEDDEIGPVTATFEETETGR